ncbi:hypothetical protein BO86DRAFT_123781 [Aspergillus japonicus CBS 114.51]|uniref:Uncharacterized protein n=1 Tax=Aspergillus japonicus CBS 114.51 TaxID=1448312 RepID=A0A8T8WYU1_ASPJA|nr:hypothetical protein BO86DRAFT_123781 [Aspergillus japonicus CBS 114.51]RAH80572.1 hypothetical protein BO86DRAFT_123781 [Aspergillus japonicus CBS 114.51]
MILEAYPLIKSAWISRGWPAGKCLAAARPLPRMICTSIFGALLALVSCNAAAHDLPCLIGANGRNAVGVLIMRTTRRDYMNCH